MSAGLPIVVLGAGYGGLLAAFRLAGKTDTPITLINSSPWFVERVRLHQLAAGQIPRSLSIPHLLRGTHIQFVQGTVTALHPDISRLDYQADGMAHTLQYAALLFAAGSTIDRDSLPGVRDYAEVLTAEGALSLRSKLTRASSGARLLVCGGGLTGIEAAAEFAAAYPHIHVSLVTRGILGDTLSGKGQAYLRRTFERLGIEVHEGNAVQKLEAATAVTDAGRIPFDICLWTGAFSVSSLARDAGIRVNSRGQMQVDAVLRSLSHPNIFGAGDAAEPVEHLTPIRMACATAMPMAARAADNVAAVLQQEKLQPFHMRYYFQCISLGRGDALIQRVHADDTPMESVITGKTGALFKELICRYTVFSLRLEKHLPGSYVVPGRSDALLLRSGAVESLG